MLDGSLLENLLQQRTEGEVAWFFRQHPDAYEYSDRMVELIALQQFPLEHAYRAAKNRALYA
jgi:hypothetical protein